LDFDIIQIAESSQNIQLRNVPSNLETQEKGKWVLNRFLSKDISNQNIIIQIFKREKPGAMKIH